MTTLPDVHKQNLHENSPEPQPYRNFSELAIVNNRMAQSIDTMKAVEPAP